MNIDEKSMKIDEHQRQFNENKWKTFEHR